MGTWTLLRPHMHRRRTINTSQSANSRTLDDPRLPGARLRRIDPRLRSLSTQRANAYRFVQFYGESGSLSER